MKAFPLKRSKYEDSYLNNYFFDKQLWVRGRMTQLVSMFANEVCTPLTANEDTGKVDEYGATIYKLVPSGVSRVSRKFLGTFQPTAKNEAEVERVSSALLELIKDKALTELRLHDALHLKALYYTLDIMLKRLRNVRYCNYKYALKFPKPLYSINLELVTKLYNKDVDNQVKAGIIEREGNGKQIAQTILKELSKTP